MAQYTEAQQRFRPEPVAWCMLDVLNHLNMAEQGVYEFVAVKRDPKRMPERLRWDVLLRTAAMMVVLKSPIRFKAPARIKSPITDKDFRTLQAEWMQARSRLRDFVRGMPPELQHAPVFKHPFFGFLGIAQTMRFLKEHTDHHIRQLKRIAASPEFPSSDEM